MSNDLDARLQAFKAADAILAALQAAFGQQDLLNGKNPLLYVRDKPEASKVWVCDPESREESRDGGRSIVMVTRGDYQPQELHLNNQADGNFSGGRRSYSDLATTPIMVLCEAGNKIASETLASVVYSILKLFRQDLMADYDINSIKFNSIGSAIHNPDQPGKAWVTTVNLRVETQERADTTELATHLNRTDIAAAFAATQERRVASLDSTPQ